MESDEQGQLLPNIIFSEDQSYATVTAEMVRDLLLHDVEDKDRVERLIPEFLFKQATQPFMEPVQLSEENFGSVAKYYVRATMDKVMSVSLQDRMLTHWPVEKVITLNSGHLPLTSMANKLSDTIQDFADYSNSAGDQKSKPNTTMATRVALASAVIMFTAVLFGSVFSSFANANQAPTDNSASQPQYQTQHHTINVEFHLLDTGHFALEEDGQVIADYIRNFLSTKGS
jgi:hypothetical protein